MAKARKQDRVERGEPAGSSGARGALAAGEALARARKAMSRGDVRAARALARQISSSGPEADKAEAQALLERTRPDPQSMLVAAAVLAVIWSAIWAALLRH